jgi:hypothetical protein
MSMPRYAARRDANEPALVQVARACGAYLYQTDDPGDWLCGYRGRWVVVEIKTENGSPTPNQIRFSREARERRLPYWTWRTEDDVLHDLGAARGA